MFGWLFLVFRLTGPSKCVLLICVFLLWHSITTGKKTISNSIFFKAYCSDKKLLLDHICGKLFFSSDLPSFQYPHDTPCVVCCRSGGNRGGRADRAAAEPAVPATSPNLFCKRALRKAGKANPKSARRTHWAAEIRGLNMTLGHQTSCDQ